MVSDIDLLIVGAGLTGATIARLAKDTGFNPLVIEARDVVGGNVRDAIHDSGIRYGLYGPHYFRTSSTLIWEFVNRFASFREWSAEIKTVIDGNYEDWPITEEYMARHYGELWSTGLARHVSATSRNFVEACYDIMPGEIFERFVRGYTEKQWGVPCETLDADLARRFEVRRGPDRRLKRAVYQGLPMDGYANWIQRMLAGIEVHCSRTAAGPRYGTAFPLTVHTGPIDACFDFKLGKLAYRGQVRELIWNPSLRARAPTIQTNYPNPADAMIRDIEWKHMAPGHWPPKGTLITREYPYSPDDPNDYEYPFPDKANRDLYWRYVELALRETPNTVFVGRLAEYRYLDMDQAIARAMQKWETEICPRLSRDL